MPIYHDAIGSVSYEIVGSPTITNGTVSGFSADDYLKLSQTVSSGTAKTFEIFTKFTTPASFSADSSLICIQTYFSYGLRIMKSDSSSATLYATSHSNSTYYNINSTSGAILPSTTYYAQYIVDGENGTQTLRISTDKQNWSEFTGEYSTGYYNDSSILWLVGKSVYGASECSIDLNETYIKVNGQPFFGKCPVKVQKIIYKGQEVLKVMKDGKKVFPDPIPYYAYTNASDISVYTLDNPINNASFNLQNATVEGSLTEVGGVYTGFVNNGYIDITDNLPSITSSGKLIFKVKCKNPSNQQYIICGKYENKCILFEDSKLRYWSGSGGVSGSTTFVNDYTYWIGINLEPNKLTAYIIIDNDNTYTKNTLPEFNSVWTKEFEYSSNVFQNLKCILGRSYNSTSYNWLGSIDMNNTYFEFDNDIINFGEIIPASTLYNSSLQELSPQPSFNIQAPGLINASVVSFTDLGNGKYKGANDGRIVLSDVPDWQNISTWSFIIKVQFDSYRTQILLGSAADQRPILIFDNYGRLTFYPFDGNSYTNYNLNYSLSQFYYVKIYFTGTQYKVDLSTTGEFSGEEVNYFDISSTTKVSSTSNVWIGNNSYNTSQYVDGTIDMTETSFTADGITTTFYSPNTSIVINNVDYVRTPANDLSD